MRTGATEAGKSIFGVAGGITDGISGRDCDAFPHIPPRFQFQVHVSIPVSICCVIPPPVVSPHVQVQFQTQFAGSEELSGTGGADGITVPLDADPACGDVAESPVACGAGAAP
jgi:hypothetical protein